MKKMKWKAEEGGIKRNHIKLSLRYETSERLLPKVIMDIVSGRFGQSATSGRPVRSYNN